MEKRELAPGEVLLDRFRIEKQLGEGYSAIVYEATDLTMNRQVALKVIPAHEGMAERVRREIQTAASLNHPNIVTVHDFIETPDSYVVVMELVKGATLRQALRRKGRIPWQKAVYVIIQVAEALKEAHAREIIHRDVKPENIMITRDGRIKLADFGIAVLIQRGNHERKASGTLGYMSPEQITGRYVDETTDIFALGVILYEMLTGKNPFYADSLKETALRVLNYTPPPPSKVFPALPEALDQVVMQAIGKDPEFRFQSAAQFIKALKAIQSTEISISEPAPAAPEQVAEMAVQPLSERAGMELTHLRRYLLQGFFMVSMLVVLFGSLSLGKMYAGIAGNLIPLGIVLVGILYPAAALWLAIAAIVVPVFATNQLLGFCLGIALATYAFIFGYGKNAYFSPLPFLALYLWKIGLFPVAFLLAGLVLEPGAALLSGVAAGIVGAYVAAFSHASGQTFFGAATVVKAIDVTTLDGILKPLVSDPSVIFEICLAGAVAYLVALVRRGIGQKLFAIPVSALVGLIAVYFGYVILPSIQQGVQAKPEAALVATIPSAIVASIVALFLSAGELGQQFLSTTTNAYRTTTSGQTGHTTPPVSPPVSASAGVAAGTARPAAHVAANDASTPNRTPQGPGQ